MKSSSSQKLDVRSACRREKSGSARGAPVVWLRAETGTTGSGARPIGMIVGTQSFSSSAPIFNNEDWTRVQIIAAAPQQASSVLDTHYGTPSIDQSGHWT